MCPRTRSGWVRRRQGRPTSFSVHHAVARWSATSAGEPRCLDHRRREAGPGDTAADGVADGLGRAQHPVESFEVGASLVDGGTCLVGGVEEFTNSGVVSIRSWSTSRRTSRSVSRTRISTTINAAKPIEQSTAATTSTSSPALIQAPRPIGGGGAASIHPFPIDASSPWTLGSYQWRCCSESGRYCCSTVPDAWS